MVCNLALQAEVAWFCILAIGYQGLGWAKNSELAVGADLVLRSLLISVELWTQLQRLSPRKVAPQFPSSAVGEGEMLITPIFDAMLINCFASRCFRSQRQRWSVWAVVLQMLRNCPSSHSKWVAEREIIAISKFYSLYHFHSTPFKNEISIS